MDLYEFNVLNMQQQATATWELGVQVAERMEGEMVVIFYQLPKFYVEVFYDKISNEISKFRSFKALKQLDPYIEGIRLSF